MATDVSGTIHIIAEVMGDAGSPIAGTGANAKSSDKAKQKRLQVSVFGMAFDVKQIIKYLTIGGLIANSKTLSAIATSLFYFLGVIADIFFAPLLPTLLWTLENMFKFLTYLSKLTRGEKSFSEVWGDWSSFWSNQWDEGGLLGIIKNMFKLGTGLTIFSTLFAGMISGPAGVSFVLSSVFKWSGGKFGLDVIANVIGIKKAPKLSDARKGTKAARTARYIKQKALKLTSMIGRFLPIGKAIVTVGAILAIFGLSTIPSPPFLTGSDGLIPKIKEQFFSGSSISWTGVLDLLKLFGVGAGMSLLQLIEFITFGVVSAEETKEWLIEKLVGPLNRQIEDILDAFKGASSLTGDFLEDFFGGSITIGQDFMNIITSPLEILSREQ